MPLDGSQPKLVDVASWIGIKPVPASVLEQHKLAELAKHPGSWWYRHEKLADNLINFGGLGLLLIAAFSLAGALIGPFYMGLTTAWGIFIPLGVVSFISFMGMVYLSDGVKVTGPARWEESEYAIRGDFSLVRCLAALEMPPSIRETAIRIMNRDGLGSGGLTLVYGKLMQESILLDPYLAIRRGDDMIVLGIWDGDTIIQEAADIS